MEPENTTLLIFPIWPISDFFRIPIDTQYIPIVCLLYAEAKNSPHGEKATQYTIFSWSQNFLIRSPFDTLHTPTVQSHDPEAKYYPLGENATLNT